MTDKISLVLPVYNIEAWLPACMDSVLSQTYGNIEILLVDDGSKKECAELCDSYASLDNRVKAFHKCNGGLSDARNFGIAHATGDWIICIDPDDTVDRDMVEYLYSLAQKYETKLAIARHRVLFENGNVEDFGESGECLLSAHDAIKRMLYHDGVDTSAWGKLYHKSLFEGIRYPVGKLFEDIATTYKLFEKAGTIILGHESKYNYAMRGTSIVNSTFKRSKLDLLEMTDAMAKDVVSWYPDLADAVLRRQVYARFSTLNQMLDTTEAETEKKEIIHYIRANDSQVLQNSRTPKRDKAAIHLLRIGYPVYRFFWKQYKRIKKG